MSDLYNELPAIGDSIFIQQASTGDKWIKVKVTGYYVWPDLGGDKYLKRVFVKFKYSSGEKNSRMLHEIKREGDEIFTGPIC